MEKLKLFSPFQVACASFFGGPIAAVYALKKNYEVLGQPKEARETLTAGIVFIILLVIVLPFLPDKFPNFAIPAGYTSAAYAITKRFQLPKPGSNFEAQGIGGIVALCVVCLIVFLAIAFAYIFLLSLLGVEIGKS